MGIPNLSHDSLPVGKSDEDNIEVKKWGTIPGIFLCPKTPL